VVTGLLVVLLVNRLFFPAQPANCRPATVAFFGLTNLPSGQCAILALENQSPTPLKLRNIGYLEYYRRPVNNSFNRSRSYAAGTNFVLQSGQRQQLFLPVSEEGTSWYVYLEFAHTGFLAKLAESLQKIRSRWVEILPEGVRTVRSAPVILHLHREDPLAKDGGVAGVAPINIMFLLARLARVTKVMKRWVPNPSLLATPVRALQSSLSREPGAPEQDRSL
jgi:hypothetical protein